MITGLLIVRLTLATLQIPASATPGQGQVDPCSLLKPAELRSLAPNVGVGRGVSSTVPAVGSAKCEYAWGTSGKVAVMVSAAARLYPRLEPEMIKQGLFISARAAGQNGAVIPGVGDAAIVFSDSPASVKTTALVKTVLLQIDVDGPDARGKQEQVIALLKAAAERL